MGSFSSLVFNLQVRIEDNVVITATGCDLLTDVPRTVEEIEDWMQKGMIVVL